MSYENDAIGFLQVAVKTASGALPVEGAYVTVYEYSPKENGKTGNIVYSLVTDNTGKTDKVALKTKSKSLSMSPSDTQALPYTTYNIGVSKEGYYGNRYINVPIFEGVTAIQPVELMPLLEYASPVDDLPFSYERFGETPNTDL